LLEKEVRELQVQVVQICGVKEKRSVTLVTNYRKTVSYSCYKLKERSHLHWLQIK
jgi:hypothetical protein